MLEPLENMTIEEAVMFLLSFENALDYDREELLRDYPDTSEELALGMTLCGNSNFVKNFISGKDSGEFFRNVGFNSVDCVPLILRVINLRLNK